LLSSLVKYEFFPIFAAIVVYLCALLHQTYHFHFAPLRKSIGKDWLKLSNVSRVLLVMLFTVSLTFFVQRDGTNIIKYHTISPDCGVVLSVKDCSAYSVWSHDYSSHNQVVASQNTVDRNPFEYFWQWMYWLWYRLFFGINGVSSGYTNYPPLPLPSAGFILVVFAGAACVIKWRKRIFKDNNYMLLLSVIIVLYLFALLLEGYMKYEYTDVLELMNGRYLLPIVPVAAAIVGKGFSVALKNKDRLRAYFAVAAIALFIQGGGFLTFITLSDSTWDWQNSLVVKANNDARKIADVFVINGKKTYSTSRWFFN
jgi:hypothetical protein